MSFHRMTCMGCCSHGPPCSTNWDTCADPQKVSVTGFIYTRQGSACDSGSVICSGWEGLTIEETFSIDVENVQYAWVGANSRFEVVAAASNTGTVTFSWVNASDVFPFNETAAFACDGAYSSTVSASFGYPLNAPSVDCVVTALSGMIESVEIDGTCIFRLTMLIECFKYDTPDIDQLVPSSGGKQTIQTTNPGTGFRMTLTATAPYSATTCPSDSTWTVESLNYAILLGGVSGNYLNLAAIPQAPVVDLCPIGSGLDCTVGFETPADCFYGLGWDSVWFLYFGGGTFDMSGFTLHSMDTPSLLVSA